MSLIQRVKEVRDAVPGLSLQAAKDIAESRAGDEIVMLFREARRDFGLSKREHIAAMAMQGLMASETPDDVFESTGVAERSVELADALLVALEES